jgi:hypothetical protein
MKPSYFRSSRCCCICVIVSSATPTTMSSDVPPNWNGTFTTLAIAIGSSAMAVRKSAPGQRDALDHLLDVLGRLRPGAHAGHEPALLLEVLRQVDRVEDDRRVEVREQHDQDGHEAEVQPRPGLQRVGDVARPGLPGKNWAAAPGTTITLCAKMIGITPAC